MPAGKKLKNGLTAVQEKYCRERALGKTQKDAYTASHPNSKASGKSREDMATRMERKELLRQRIAELQDRVDAGLIPSLEQIQADIADMAADESRPDAIRIKAYDQLTRMRGGYRDAVSVTGSVSIDDRRSALADLLPDA